MSKINGMGRPPPEFIGGAKKTSLPEGDAFSLLIAAAANPVAEIASPALTSAVPITVSGLPGVIPSQVRGNPGAPSVIPHVPTQASAFRSIPTAHLGTTAAAPGPHDDRTIPDLDSALVEAVLYPEDSVAAEFLSELPGVDPLVSPADFAMPALTPQSVDVQMPVKTTVTSVAGDLESHMQQQAATGHLRSGHLPFAESTSEHERAEESAPMHYPAAPMPFPERNFHLVVQSGEYHLWLRDYRMAESEKRNLVHRLLQALNGAGRSVASISLNGQRLWSSPTPISISRT